jgi:hypothetical protein
LNDAEKSGMRGRTPRRSQPVTGSSPVKETDPEYNRPETASEENMADIIGQHILGPDEKGHRSLDLTSLSHHIAGKKNPKSLEAMERNSEGKLHESPRVPPEHK